MRECDDFKRRDFLRVSWTLGAGLVVPPVLSSCGSDSTDPAPPETFVDPPMLSSKGGMLDFTLTLSYLTTTLNGQTVTLRNMGGAIPAPTLSLDVGDTLRIRMINQLPPNPPDDEPTRHLRFHNSTNLHTHGLHVDPGILGPDLYGDYVMDDPALGVQPGETRQYQYTLRTDHPDGAFWYHPHLHGSSAMQVGSGMAGMLMVRGPVDQVPEIAAARERIFVFQAPFAFGASGTIDSFGQIANNPTAEPDYLINGVRRPRLVMRSGEVQTWRFLNAAIWKSLNLSLDAHTLYIFGHDGNPRRDLLPSDPIPPDAPGTPEALVLAPGNRASVLVKAGRPGTYYLRTMAFEMGRTSNGGGSILAEDILAEVVVVEGHRQMFLPGKPLPVTPFLDPITDEELAAHGGLKRHIYLRAVFNPPPNPSAGNPPITDPPASQIVHPGADIDDWVYSTGQTSIDNKVFAIGSDGTRATPQPGPPAEYIPFQSPRALTQLVAFESVEEWTIFNANNIRHPFHIHVNPMYVVKINGAALDNPYWVDTLALPNQGTPGAPTSITFRMRFVHYKGPYVMHCHMLVHEDMGMMQGVTVV